MRYAYFLTIGCAVALGGCQQLHLKTPEWLKAQQHAAATTSDHADSSNPSISMLQRIKQHYSPKMLHDFTSACLEKSRLYQPSVVGQIIDSPSYALVTVQKTSQSVRGGELCIVNKINHRVEVTAIDDLQFMSSTTAIEPPAAPVSPATMAQESP